MVTLPEAKLYINGVVRGAAGNRTYDTIGPWTGEVVGKAADASPADVEEAIATARKAFDTTDWSTNHSLRHSLLTKLRDLLAANKQRLYDIAQHEIGSAQAFIAMAQVDGAIGGFSTLLEVFKSLKWEEDRGPVQFPGLKFDRIVIHEAIGVVGAITPWNVPLYVNIAKVASGLLAGCTLILKPAPSTPSMATILGELAAEAGFPPGVFNVITAKDPVMAGETLVTDPRVDLITFTGSTGVGKLIMEKGAQSLKRVFLELGGKSANIILDDAPDFAGTVERAGTATVSHAGQGCAIFSRLLVPQSRYPEALKALEKAYANYGDAAWGDPKAPTHVMGPVNSKQQQERVLSYIEIGKKEGARLLAGGKARPDRGGGFFVEPTCFVDVKNTMRIAQEEIFGPVIVVIPFKDDEDAIRIANESNYGLAGGVVSGDKARAMRVARRIRAGNISANGGLMIMPDLPFGGYKHSGIGREWGLEGIEEYMETKVIAVGV